MADRYEQITKEELDALNRADKVGTQHDVFLEALNLINHLEDQKELLERKQEQRTSKRITDKAADIIARFSGSIWFVLFHLLWFGFWIVANAGGIGSIPQFDPQYEILTMIVSLEAIFLATFILISQNRQAELSKSRDEIDFERDRLDLKVDTVAAKNIRETTLKIGKIERDLMNINAKLDLLVKKKKR